MGPVDSQGWIPSLHLVTSATPRSTSTSLELVLIIISTYSKELVRLPFSDSLSSTRDQPHKDGERQTRLVLFTSAPPFRRSPRVNPQKRPSRSSEDLLSVLGIDLRPKSSLPAHCKRRSTRTRMVDRIWEGADSLSFPLFTLNR